MPGKDVFGARDTLEGKVAFYRLSRLEELGVDCVSRLLSPGGLRDIRGARILALLGDSVTTDHISPAGDIAEKSPAGHYLKEHGVVKRDFNTYGARRGNDRVLVRGTFANIRLKNLMVPGVEGGVTLYLPSSVKDGMGAKLCPSLMPPRNIKRVACRSSLSQAKNMARVPRTTGLPKGRYSWASRRR